MKRLFLALLAPAIMSGQNVPCSLSGKIQDAAGVVVPNPKVTLTGEQNRFVRTVETTGKGLSSFPDLTPATLLSPLKHKTYRQTGILINADEQRSLGRVKLSVGQVSESITQ